MIIINALVQTPKAFHTRNDCARAQLTSARLNIIYEKNGADIKEDIEKERRSASREPRTATVDR